jgi:hypothetical protein
MEFIAEVVQFSCDRQWNIDFYRYKDDAESATASTAMQELEELHRDRVVVSPMVLRVSICLCVIGPLNRLLVATRGLINSQCNPRELASLLRSSGQGNEGYIRLLEQAVRTTWP